MEEVENETTADGAALTVWSAYELVLTHAQVK